MPVKEALAALHALDLGESFSYWALAKKTRLLSLNFDALT
jgi:hypothetical protein